jgi:hypothetical protein
MNNEQAFPNPHRTDITGMTLRDYFAAKAMQAAITGCATRAEVGLYSDWAGFAYEMADAMLKAREE